jgi:hypothetical protein
LHEKSIPFFQPDKLGFGDRILVDSFLDLSQPHILKAASYLGYPSPINSKSKKQVTAINHDESAPT